MSPLSDVVSSIPAGAIADNHIGLIASTAAKYLDSQRLSKAAPLSLNFTGSGDGRAEFQTALRLQDDHGFNVQNISMMDRLYADPSKAQPLRRALSAWRQADPSRNTAMLPSLAAMTSHVLDHAQDGKTILSLGIQDQLSNFYKPGDGRREVQNAHNETQTHLDTMTKLADMNIAVPHKIDVQLNGSGASEPVIDLKPHALIGDDMMVNHLNKLANVHSGMPLFEQQSRRERQLKDQPYQFGGKTRRSQKRPKGTRYVKR